MKNRDDYEQLKAENSLLRKIIDEIPASVYWKNKEGIYLGRNRYAARKMVEQGFEAVENRDFVVGRSDHMLFHASMADEFCKNDAIILESGKESVVEEFFLAKTGDPYHHLSIKKPLYNEEGQSLGIVGISIDIGERKAAEEREKTALIQVEREKESKKIEIELRRAVMIFAGSLAHDLRTLIATLRLTQQTIKKNLRNDLNLLPVSSSAWLSTKQATIEKTIQRMQAVIQTSLLMLGDAFQNEAMPQHLMLCSMWRCLHQTLLYYPFLAGERALITWDQTDFSFNGNELLMIRVLSNLLDNALYQIRQNKRGKISIEARSDALHHCLHFEDTAGGVSAELISRLFTGYHTTKTDGTGVGLAFCKLTLQRWGGDITCHLVQGNFIEFVLMLPRCTSS